MAAEPERVAGSGGLKRSLITEPLLLKSESMQVICCPPTLAGHPDAYREDEMSTKEAWQTPVLT